MCNYCAVHKLISYQFAAQLSTGCLSKTITQYILEARIKRYDHIEKFFGILYHQEPFLIIHHLKKKK